MFSELGIVIAFVAGLVSFLSPCVLPLIPGFLSYLAGTSLNEASNHRREVFLNSLMFVFGFSFVFATFGVILNTILEAVAYDASIWAGRLGGLVIIFFGLYLTGLLKLSFMEKQKSFSVKKKFNSRYVTSFVFGAAFAVGWSPCVGAVLGAIFGLAATQPGAAFTLLLSYALGLGLPFLVVGLFALPASKLINKYAKYAKVVNIIFGFLLIGLGVLIFTNSLSAIANFEFAAKWLSEIQM